jgi:hypothetical protein
MRNLHFSNGIFKKKVTVLTVIPSEIACPELAVALSEVEGVVEREGSGLTISGI